MRGIALGMPLILVLLIAILSGIRALLDGAPYAFRFEGTAGGAMGGFAVAFVATAATCRDTAEFRATRGWFLVALGLVIVTAAAITWVQGARWGAWIGFTVSTLVCGALAVLVAHGRGLARGQE